MAISKIPLNLILLGTLLFSSCKKGDNFKEAVIPPNSKPVAKAGADTAIALPLNFFLLDGLQSYDPDNNITGYSWAKISGPSSFHITKTDDPQTQVSGLVQGLYQFELTVADSGGLSARDTIVILVDTMNNSCIENSRPLVIARLVPAGKLSEARGGAVVATAGNKIFFAAAALSGTSRDYGSSRVDIYDLNTLAWTRAELSVKRSEPAVIAAGNKVFFAGGRLGDGAFDLLYSTVDIYDIATNTWSTAALSEPRAYVTAATVGDNVLFAGGEKDWDYQTSDKVDIYNLVTNQWSTTTLSCPRAAMSAVTVGDKVYFAGGNTEDRYYTPSDRVDVFDNLTNTWSVSTLKKPMNFLTGISGSNKIYWAAGCDMYIFDPLTGQTSTEHLSRPTMWNADKGNDAVVKDNKILFFNYSATYPIIPNNKQFDIYDINTKTWSIGLLPVGIDFESVISVNNTVYIAGGYIDDKASDQVWKLEF